MRRVVTLFALFLFALPFGINLTGCGGKSRATYCDGSSGPIVGQVQNITLQPQIGGVSLNYAQHTTLTTPTATDCNGDAVTVSSYVYHSTGQSSGILDINPSTGAICAGKWNRNSAGGIADYSTCTSTGIAGVSEVSVEASGASSNKIEVYVHPVITEIEIGEASTDCTNDPATNCSQYTASEPLTTAVPTYSPNDCISFGTTSQIVARFYKGPSSDPSNNITYSAGHATFTALTSGLVTFDNDRGIATATAPGSTVVTASIGPTGLTTTSNAGFVAVCPPKSITITTPNSTDGSVDVNVNNTEPITATVIDTKNVAITGLTLTYNSTSPISTPVSSSGITPAFAGGAAVNAFCLPPTCNPAPQELVGRYPNGTPSGNGKPVSSNTIVTHTSGTTSSLLWVASTDSFYLLPVDLTADGVSNPLKLPYQPNSMALTQDGAYIFLGTDSGLMTFTTSTSAVSAFDANVQGQVLAASPNSTDVIVTDPARKLVYVYRMSTTTTNSTTGTSTTNAAGVVSSYSGVGTRASWTPDGTTAYILTSDNHLLVYNTQTSWHSYDLSATGTLHDVIAAVPAVGALVGSSTAVNGRSYCPNTATTTTDFYPSSLNTTVSSAVSDRLGVTNDGIHLLDVRLAEADGTPIMNDLLLGSGAGLPKQECPEDGTAPTFTAAVNTAVLTGLKAAAVTGVYPASDSSIAFITNTPASDAAATGAVLAAYKPAASGAGTVSTVTLSDGATAAVAGAMSNDNLTFFAGTTGDNLVHEINVSTLTDQTTFNPSLPSASNASALAVPNLIAARPRTAIGTTSTGTGATSSVTKSASKR